MDFELGISCWFGHFQSTSPNNAVAEMDKSAVADGDGDNRGQSQTNRLALHGRTMSLNSGGSVANPAVLDTDWEALLLLLFEGGGRVWLERKECVFEGVG